MIATQSRTSQPPPQALGINVEKPKFPQYAVCTKRLESFETWPEYIPVSKNDLVEAGLVYTGTHNYVHRIMLITLYETVTLLMYMSVV